MTLPSSHAFRQPSKKCLVCIVQLTVFLDQKHHQNLSWRVGKFKYYKPLKTQNNVKRKSYDKHLPLIHQTIHLCCLCQFLLPISFNTFSSKPIIQQVTEPVLHFV